MASVHPEHEHGMSVPLLTKTEDEGLKLDRDRIKDVLPPLADVILSVNPELEVGMGGGLEKNLFLVRSSYIQMLKGTSGKSQMRHMYNLWFHKGRILEVQSAAQMVLDQTFLAGKLDVEKLGKQAAWNVIFATQYGRSDVQSEAVSEILRLVTIFAVTEMHWKKNERVRILRCPPAADFTDFKVPTSKERVGSAPGHDDMKPGGEEGQYFIHPDWLCHNGPLFFKKHQDKPFSKSITEHVHSCPQTTICIQATLSEMISTLQSQYDLVTLMQTKLMGVMMSLFFALWTVVLKHLQEADA